MEPLSPGEGGITATGHNWVLGNSPTRDSVWRRIHGPKHAVHYVSIEMGMITQSTKVV